jgi:pimeloyl-ACP methyl ester carboxylesterase
MPFIQVNGANLYYETFGKEQPNRLPIVLIHGSTSTVRNDWQMVAPLLGREYYVIVPDCRGHGQSSNPQHSYSFKEMAADTAALIRALGYERAHLIGHSNGGNDVLVALLEHPEVVQSSLAQAANAYVSQDLIEKQPAIFDPARVARQAPNWVQEIISYPNYTPAQLAEVKLPTLVVQGEKDSVNAPARHAQFIAQHIPAAELWIAPGIGHNVHLELPALWNECSIFCSGVEMRRTMPFTACDKPVIAIIGKQSLNYVPSPAPKAYTYRVMSCLKHNIKPP